MPQQEGISGPSGCRWASASTCSVPLWQHKELLVILTITLCPCLISSSRLSSLKVGDLSSSSVGPGLGWGSFSTFSKWKEYCNSYSLGVKEKATLMGDQEGHQVEDDIWAWHSSLMVVPKWSGRTVFACKDEPCKWIPPNHPLSLFFIGLCISVVETFPFPGESWMVAARSGASGTALCLGAHLVIAWITVQRAWTSQCLG